MWTKCMINEKVHSRHGIDSYEGLNKNGNQYSGRAFTFPHTPCMIVGGSTLNVV